MFYRPFYIMHQLYNIFLQFSTKNIDLQMILWYIKKSCKRQKPLRGIKCKRISVGMAELVYCTGLLIRHTWVIVYRGVVALSPRFLQFHKEYRIVLMYNHVQRLYNQQLMGYVVHVTITSGRVLLRTIAFSKDRSSVRNRNLSKDTSLR